VRLLIDIGEFRAGRAGRERRPRVMVFCISIDLVLLLVKGPKNGVVNVAKNRALHSFFHNDTLGGNRLILKSTGKTTGVAKGAGAARAAERAEAARSAGLAEEHCRSCASPVCHKDGRNWRYSGGRRYCALCMLQPEFLAADGDARFNTLCDGESCGGCAQPEDGGQGYFPGRPQKRGKLHHKKGRN
jgi:hypothetical protein